MRSDLRNFVHFLRAKSYDWFKRGIVRLGSDEDFYDFARVDEREK